LLGTKDKAKKKKKGNCETTRKKASMKTAQQEEGRRRNSFHHLEIAQHWTFHMPALSIQFMLCNQATFSATTDSLLFSIFTSTDNDESDHEAAYEWTSGTPNIYSSHLTSSPLQLKAFIEPGSRLAVTDSPFSRKLS